MKHFVPVVIASVVLGCGAAAASAGGAAPAQRRIVMHGVDCLIENGSICAEEQPVLDEVLSEVDPDVHVVVRTDVQAVGLTDGSAHTLSPASIDAICEYLSDGGVDAVSVDGDMIVQNSNRPRIDLQLSHTTR